MPVSDNKFRNKVELIAERGVVSVQVIERESEAVVESREFDASGVHENVRPLVGLYGLSKLLQDRSSETPTGPGKLSAMQEVYDLLSRGEWERERKAGAPVVSAEVEALAEIKKITVAQAQAALRKFTKEQKDKILSNPAIVAKAAEIRAARETSNVDLSDLA